MTRKVLGRGLSSLIPDAEGEAAERPATLPYVEIDLDQVEPNPHQPRQRFSDQDLRDLAASIARHGVVQPILVRRRDGRFQMVAGERRLRAAQQAGLRKIPAVIRDIPDERMLEVALVENIQRAELDPIEEARAFQALLGDLGLTQAEVAERVGKDRSTISNSLRLLNLDDWIQNAVRDGVVTAGHARALLALPPGPARDRLARRIVRGGISVRQAERLAAPAARPAGQTASTGGDPNTRAAEEALMHALGTRVRIRRAGAGGTVEISFHNEEELQRIYDQIMHA